LHSSSWTLLSCDVVDELGCPYLSHQESTSVLDLIENGKA
jgi:hypothetical protein